MSDTVSFGSGYVQCHRCGCLHDDGTPHLCFNCLDLIYDKSDSKEIGQEINNFYKTARLENEIIAIKFEEINNVFTKGISNEIKNFKVN